MSLFRVWICIEATKFEGVISIGLNKRYEKRHLIEFISFCGKSIYTPRVREFEKVD